METLVLNKSLGKAIQTMHRAIPDLEFSYKILGHREGDRIVLTDILFPYQYGNSKVHTCISECAENALEERKYFKEENKQYWVYSHSHNTMGVTPSGTDEASLRDYSLALGESKGIFRFITNNAGEVNIDYEINGVRTAFELDLTDVEMEMPVFEQTWAEREIRIEY